MPPMSAPRLRQDLPQVLSKRKLEEPIYPRIDKTSRSDGPPIGHRHNTIQHESLYRPNQGTQQDPLEIESSPEPEPQITRHVKGQARSGEPKSGHDTLRETDLFIQGPSNSSGKPKYYAVAGGHVPGIYTDWARVQEQLEGYSGTKQQKFGSQPEAWAYLEKHRSTVFLALSRKNGASESPARMSALFPTPQSTRPNPFDHPEHWSSPPPYSRHPQALGSFSKYSDVPEPDYTPLHPQIAPPPDPTASAHAPQRAVQSDVPAEIEPTLSAEQQEVVNIILSGRNTFYTGSAGCGKSTILKAFVRQLKARGQRVRIIAPTNLAALNVNGQTTWSFAGWTPDSMSKPLTHLEAVSHGKEIYARFKSTDVLVIDEISMIENHIFERLNVVMKASRGDNRPFGGVQLVVTGDFYQLSPVKPFSRCIDCGGGLKQDNRSRPSQYECKPCDRLELEIDKWAFRSNAWAECNFKLINLTEIHRQNDKKFISILQRIRTDGCILRPHANLLLNHASETEGAIQLHSRRNDVERINNERINQLDSIPVTYKCVDHFSWKDHHRDDESLEKYNKKNDVDGTLHQLKAHRYDVFVQLKTGMKVVLQANLDPDAGLVNGTQGIIVAFENFEEMKLPQKPEGRSDYNLSGAPALRGPHAKYFQHQIKHHALRNKFQAWPVVQFDNGVTRTIFPDCTANELGNDEPYSLLSRTQIPLMAGYAVTVHKAQGMTLERVVVNLTHAFEHSQVYVALSRATSLQGLKVTSLPTGDLGGANAQVKEFMASF